MRLRDATAGGAKMEIEEATRRSKTVIERIHNLPLSKVSASCKANLLRLANSELNFLSHLSSSSSSLSSSLSCNVGYIEAIIHILEQPYITGVSRVCKLIPLSSDNSSSNRNDSRSPTVHVDIICTFCRKPTWFIISDRNPNYISWDSSGRYKGLKVRIEQTINTACSSQALKPAFVVLFFTNGLENTIREKAMKEFGFREFGLEFLHFEFAFSDALEDGWVNVFGKSYQRACTLIKNIDQSPRLGQTVNNVVELSSYSLDKNITEKYNDLSLQPSFHSIIQEMKEWPSDVNHIKSVKRDGALMDDDLVNFDTTALIAIVSGISNGGAERILATPKNELMEQFKSNTEFVLSQAMSEFMSPIHAELNLTLFSRKGIACESVRSEFMELISMCGGPNEQTRADELVEHLNIVPNTPSSRMMCLPTTRKLALKNKVTFGTGDYWGAPTLTANMGFVRAITQTGMSLLTLEHRPRALIGD